MKFKLFYLLPVLIATSVFLQSCDGGGPSSNSTDISQDPEARAQVLSGLLDEDTISFNAVSGIDVPGNFLVGDEGLATLEFNGDIVSESLSLSYEVTGNHTFKYSGQFIDADGLFWTAMNNLFVGISSRFNLLQPDTSRPEFTRAELQTLADAFYAGGAFVYLHPTENLLFMPIEFEYNFTSNSTNQNLLGGRMFGTYSSRCRALPVNYRRPTDDEVADFNGGIRGITASHWIPVINIQDGANIVVEDFEVGSYEIILRNVTTFITN